LQLAATGATILDIDYLDENTIAKAAAAYGDEPLDVLVNCAGQSTRCRIFSFSNIKPGVDVHPRPWDENSADDMVTKFRVMTVVSLYNL
jgi:NAD(P)-dependent dehydrogenase (short-subunit alcohol dehydrogenase family)